MSAGRPEGTSTFVTRLEPTVFELSSAGCRGCELPGLDVPEADLSDLAGAVRQDVAGLPELSEVDVVRHFVRLSRLN